MIAALLLVNIPNMLMGDDGPQLYTTLQTDPPVFIHLVQCDHGRPSDCSTQFQALGGVREE
jgi:hypothetical protein